MCRKGEWDCGGLDDLCGSWPISTPVPFLDLSVERRRVRKEERDARFQNGEQRPDAGDDDEDDEAEAKGRRGAEDESEEDIDALERELDTEETGIEVIDGKHAKPVERWEQKDERAAEHDEEEETKQEPERHMRRRSARQGR